MNKKILLIPRRENFEIIINKVKSIEELAEKQGIRFNIYFLGYDKKSAEVAARLFGYSFVETSMDLNTLSVFYGSTKSYGKKRAYIKCYAESNDEARRIIIEKIHPDYIIYSDYLEYNNLDIPCINFNENINQYLL